jgi:4-amino-4-deoxy-L-arabinose transferase-like glycosyltransferase
MLFYWNGYILTETLNTFLVACSILMVIRFIAQKKLHYFILAGFFLGLASLTRPEGVLIGGFVMLWLISEKDLRPRLLKCIASFSIAFMMVTIPWIIFVSLKLGTFVPITTGGGRTFLGANNGEILKHPLARWGGWLNPSEEGVVADDELEGLSEVEQDRYFYKVSLNYIVQNPFELPRLVFWKLINLFRVHPSFYDTIFMTILAFTSYFMVFVLAMYGLTRFSMNKIETRFLLIIILGYVTNSMIFWGDTRFRSAIEPVLIIFAVYGFLSLAARFDTKWSGRKFYESSLAHD